MKRKAFTLIELMIVVAIISVFVSIIVFNLNKNKNTYKVDGQKVKVVDGCEYFVTHGESFNDTLSHKGNCTNEIHRTIRPERD